MRSFTALLAVTLVLCAVCEAEAGPAQVIRLKEYRGHTWEGELVSYPLDAALQQVQSLRVTDETGYLIKSAVGGYG